MKRKNVSILLILLCLTLTLSGCRTRTSGRPPQTDMVMDDSSGLSDTGIDSERPADAGRSDYKEAGEEGQEQKNDGPGSKTKENPDASRKEYDENAPAEVIPGTDRLLHGEGEGAGAPVISEESMEKVSRVDNQAQEAATQTVFAQESEQKGVDPDAEAADSALTYFTVLLSDRMGSLFECQRSNVYWETAQDHVTVFRASLEHSLILNAGAYDVSARLLEENLKVDDGWVARKNPGVIVKMVDGSVLGSGVPSSNAARGVYQSLLRRDNWSGIDAVKNGRIVILSEELLQAPYLQAAAMLILAKTSAPELLADVDLDEALQMLMEEATGVLPAGIYYYQGGTP